MNRIIHSNDQSQQRRPLLREYDDCDDDCDLIGGPPYALPHVFEQILNAYKASDEADTMLQEGKSRNQRLAETLFLATKFFGTEKPDVNARTSNGESLLHWAWSVDIASYLTLLGADIDAYDYMGRTPLFRALMRKDVEVAKFLVAAGADVNDCDAYGIGPLHWTAWVGDFGFVRFLVEHGANPNDKDCDHNFPLDCEITTGPLEGLNNKIKTLKRQSYGFRDQEYFKLKILAIHRTRYALLG